MTCRIRQFAYFRNNRRCRSDSDDAHRHRHKRIKAIQHKMPVNEIDNAFLEKTNNIDDRGNSFLELSICCNDKCEG